MNKILIIILLCCSWTINSQTICDSVYYNVSNSSDLTIIGVNNSNTDVTFMWGVCDSTACYSSSDDTAIFLFVNKLDVVKVCYDLSPFWICNTCEYFVYVNGKWVKSNLTSIHEVLFIYNNNRMYDLLGKELKRIPRNKIYIKNGQKQLD